MVITNFCRLMGKDLAANDDELRSISIRCEEHDFLLIIQITAAREGLCWTAILGILPDPTKDTTNYQHRSCNPSLSGLGASFFPSNQRRLSLSAARAR
ncbi:hypothetical protein LINGRAHAP2_LOCUS18606 [Linum grandiflorum]